VAAARLGARTAFAGKIGSDDRGDRILAGFRAEAVDVTGCLREEGAVSAAGFCWIEEATGRRSIAWHPGTAGPLGPAELPEALIRGAKILHLDGSHPDAALAAARLAGQAGVKVSLDAGTYGPHMPALIGLSDLVIASQGFARDLVGRDDPEAALREMAARGPRIAIVTLGPGGSLGLSGGRMFRRAAFPVPVVDTTGAGDVFHGAFCVGLLESWGLERTVDFAGAAAALKCTRVGGRTGIPGREEVIAFLHSVRSEAWTSCVPGLPVSPG